jgi:hypothetical protein
LWIEITVDEPSDMDPTKFYCLERIFSIG